MAKTPTQVVLIKPSEIKSEPLDENPLDENEDTIQDIVSVKKEIKTEPLEEIDPLNDNVDPSSVINDPLNINPTKISIDTNRPNLDPIVFNDSILAKQGKKACPMCCKLVHKTSIARHIREVHTKAKKERLISNPKHKKVCHICHKTFHISAIGRHIENLHGSAPKVPCGSCSQTFPSMDELNRHWKENHTLSDVYKNYKCKVCDKKFEKKAYLLKHEAICESKSGIIIKDESQPSTKVCPFCCKVLPVQDFAGHIQVVHKNKQIAKRTRNQDCPYCDAKLFRAKSVELHIWRCHGGEGLGGPGLKSLGLRASGFIKASEPKTDDAILELEQAEQKSKEGKQALNNTDRDALRQLKLQLQAYGSSQGSSAKPQVSFGPDAPKASLNVPIAPKDEICEAKSDSYDHTYNRIG